MSNNKYLCEKGFWSYEIELDTKWRALSHEEQEKILKYAKLLKRFSKDPNKVGIENKKWLLQNADLETDLIPLDLMQKYLL